MKAQEKIYLDMFGKEFIYPGNATVAQEDRAALIKDYARPGRMAAAFQLYSTWITHNMADNQKFMAQKLNVPVHTMGGDKSRGKTLAKQVNYLTHHPHSLILENCGH